MTDNVIHLPRPTAARASKPHLGHFLRIGWNDHKQVRDLLAEGERGYQGLVIEAQHANRHEDLLAAAQKADADLILDPKTQVSALPGGFTDSLGALPWSAGDRPHNLQDFLGTEGRSRSQRIAEFAQERGFTEVMAPTHLLQSHDDRWLSADIVNADHLRNQLPSSVPLIYSLAVPIAVLRDRKKRATLVAALRDAPMDALWIKAENFGANESGAKTADYVEALAAFHVLEVPIVADQVAGLPGLALMAFGSAGGISHGVMVNESFKASRLRRPRSDSSGGNSAPRVLIPSLGLLLKKDQAETLIRHNTRTQGRFGCRDPHCCPGGVSDMLQQPTRHYLRQRAREVERLDGIPSTARPSHYLEDNVRQQSDMMATAAALGVSNNQLAAKLNSEQARLARFRGAMAHLAESHEIRSIAREPETRSQREGRA
ncbi:hypothetical protein [Aurantimonas sp. A3-2-R12]|uniref:hypothetical protein n=1 Tax=Aurantimonas sp. A3-2-R12 TaxID=3114362 RepID=UPI002E183E32|nr:hypothetical protein [Aurantimonas sp. A3-2-R12]